MKILYTVGLVMAVLFMWVGILVSGVAVELLRLLTFWKRRD